MDKTEFFFRLDNGIDTPDEIAADCMRWFLRQLMLFLPECTFLYKDGSIKTFYADSFTHPMPQSTRWQDAVRYAAVAGLDGSDSERVTMEYVFSTGAIAIRFPQSSVLSVPAARFLAAFRNEFIDL